MYEPLPPRWRDMGVVSRTVVCLVLVPVVAGALALPVLAAWGFWTGDMVTGTICAVLAAPLVFFLVARVWPR